MNQKYKLQKFKVFKTKNIHGIKTHNYYVYIE